MLERLRLSSTLLVYFEAGYTLLWLSLLQVNKVGRLKEEHSPR